MVAQERYNPLSVGVDATVKIPGPAVYGFLAVTAGTITISKVNEISGLLEGVIIGLPVSAGVFTRIPFYLSTNGGQIEAAGGASGLLAI